MRQSSHRADSLVHPAVPLSWGRTQGSRAPAPETPRALWPQSRGPAPPCMPQARLKPGPSPQTAPFLPGSSARLPGSLPLETRAWTPPGAGAGSARWHVAPSCRAGVSRPHQVHALGFGFELLPRASWPLSSRSVRCGIPVSPAASGLAGPGWTLSSEGSRPESRLLASRCDFGAVPGQDRVTDFSRPFLQTATTSGRWRRKSTEPCASR